MELYDIETPKGICRCYEVKNIYHPLFETEADNFIGQEVLNIEIVREKEDVI
jgi:hypothetical protein